MKVIKSDVNLGDYRTDVMNFLNDFGLEAPAILSISRRVELVRFNAREDVLTQGEQQHHIYFLVKGGISIIVKVHDREEKIGEMGPVTMLGEISYFNRIPSTATVHVDSGSEALFLRISFDGFGEVIDDFPQIKPTLMRIGDLRVISQKDGFASYSFFMDMIGWKRDRLALNRALSPQLENTVINQFLARLDAQDRILDVGDGPGLICEIIHNHKPEWLDNLYIQATHLEDAIVNPIEPFPSDLSRAKFLREKFQAITALQIFDHLTPSEVGEQFELAVRLLENTGLLLVLKVKIVDISHPGGMTDSTLLFRDLKGLVEGKWPGVLEKSEELVKVTFVDADFDPSMEWNPKFCDLVEEKKLNPPEDKDTVENILLLVLMEQARRRIFNPEEIQFHWLAWHADHHGFIMESSLQRPEVGFFFQLYRYSPDAGKN